MHTPDRHFHNNNLYIVPHYNTSTAKTGDHNEDQPIQIENYNIYARGLRLQYSVLNQNGKKIIEVIHKIKYLFIY